MDRYTSHIGLSVLARGDRHFTTEMCLTRCQKDPENLTLSVQAADFLKYRLEPLDASHCRELQTWLANVPAVILCKGSAVVCETWESRGGNLKYCYLVDLFVRLAVEVSQSEPLADFQLFFEAENLHSVLEYLIQNRIPFGKSTHTIPINSCLSNNMNNLCKSLQDCLESQRL